MKKNTIITGSVIVLVAALVVGLIIWNNREPEQPTILPSGTSIEELGGWTRVETPEEYPILAYTDSIDNVSIRVSQQPMPSSFEGSIESRVSEMAKEFNATQEMESSGTKIHLGTSVQGPQYVIFSKNDLLILIRSQDKIDDESWAKYVDSLEISSSL